MKCRYGTFLVVLITAILTAHPSAGQISLAADDLTDLIGETLSMSTFTSEDAQLQAVVDAAGENQTWDFSQATIADTMYGTVSYHGSGEGMPGSDQFPESDYVIEFTMGIESAETDSAAWIYNRIKDDSVLTLGGSFVMENPDTEETDTLTLSYEPPYLNFIVPVTYGDTWTHTSTFFGSESTEEVEVDGWGTLILPDGSSYDALRIRREETTSFFGIPFTTTYIDILTTNASVAAHITLAEDNETFAMAEISTESEATSVDDDELPHTARLLQNYPNPFNPTTTLEYELATSQRVTLTVHDVLGRTVAVLVDGMRPSGEHEVAFDAADLPSGTYVYRLETAAGTQARLMTLTK